MRSAHRETRKLGSSLLIVVALTSCLTAAKVDKPAQIPVVYHPLFRSCELSEGEADLKVARVGHGVHSVVLVWNFLSARDGDLQINSAVGDSLYEVSVKSGRWSVRGGGNISIDEKSGGELLINGHDLPIRGGELGCLLAGAWPQAWLTSLRHMPGSANDHVLVAHDGFREITLSFSNKSASTEFRQTDFASCGVIKWGGFLGFFRREAEICRIQNADGVLMRLNGVGDYSAEWSIRDDA